MSKSFFDTNVLIFLLPFFQPFSMESLNKAMAEAKKPRSIQDVLMEQMAKIGGLGSGGNGGNKNRYGRGVVVLMGQRTSLLRNHYMR
jgi:hypothetical protein